MSKNFQEYSGNVLNKFIRIFLQKIRTIILNKFTKFLVENWILNNFYLKHFFIQSVFFATFWSKWNPKLINYNFLKHQFFQPLSQIWSPFRQVFKFHHQVAHPLLPHANTSTKKVYPHEYKGHERVKEIFREFLKNFGIKCFRENFKKVWVNIEIFRRNP